MKVCDVVASIKSPVSLDGLIEQLVAVREKAPAGAQVEAWTEEIEVVHYYEQSPEDVLQDERRAAGVKNQALRVMEYERLISEAKSGEEVAKIERLWAAGAI